MPLCVFIVPVPGDFSLGVLQRETRKLYRRDFFKGAGPENRRTPSFYKVHTVTEFFGTGALQMLLRDKGNVHADFSDRGS